MKISADAENATAPFPGQQLADLLSYAKLIRPRGAIVSSASLPGGLHAIGDEDVKPGDRLDPLRICFPGFDSLGLLLSGCRWNFEGADGSGQIGFAAPVNILILRRVGELHIGEGRTNVRRNATDRHFHIGSTKSAGGETQLAQRLSEDRLAVFGYIAGHARTGIEIDHQLVCSERRCGTSLRSRTWWGLEDLVPLRRLMIAA